MTTAHDLLSKTTLIDVFAYYDRPVLFSCQSESGQLFIAVLVDEGIDEHWLYAEVSAERLAAMKAGKIDLHDAFALSESGTLLDVRTARQAEESTVQTIAASSVSDDDLPMRGETA